MSAPTTLQEWIETVGELDRWRAGRGPETFPHALGLDPEPLAQWAQMDALDTVDTIVGPEVARGVDPKAIIASALATHTQIGIEIGLWLAQTGRVVA